MGRYFATFPTMHPRTHDGHGRQVAHDPKTSTGGEHAIEIDVNAIIAFQTFQSEGKPYTRIWFEGTSIQLDLACETIHVIEKISEAGDHDDD